MGKFNFKKEDFEKVKEEAKKFYAAIRKTIRLKNTALRYVLATLGYSLDSRDRAIALQTSLL